MLLHCTNNADATCSVRINRRPGANKDEPINLHEVKLYNPYPDGTRVPPAQLTAWMTSTLHKGVSDPAELLAYQYAGDAYNCNDGRDEEGNICHSLTAAQGDPSPELRVQFPCTGGNASAALGMIEVINRQANSTFQDRILQYQVQLVNADETVSKTWEFTGTSSGAGAYPGYDFVVGEWCSCILFPCNTRDTSFSVLLEHLP